MNWLSVRHPLTFNDIEQVEKELQIRLPRDYKEMIGPINGGALRNACVEVPGLGRVAFSRNVALQKGVRTGIHDLLPVFNEDSSIRLFPFASVGNGDYFCFDLYENTVVLYQHEIQSTCYVCDTFTQLIDGIITD